MDIDNLMLQKVFRYFKEISDIPRGSGNTKSISDYCVNFAKVRGLEVYQDKLNNVIIEKKATKGREGHKAVILQGHLDMVTEKIAGSKHDFLKDGLQLYVEGDFLKAKDTTLGGDDGIAIAYCLAILDSDDISHPDLQVVFTVDEETGMDGARGLEADRLKGRIMLNIDSEEEGIFVAGCAGGAKVETRIPYRNAKASGIKYELVINGLKGGHSGMEIDKERGNADILLARLLVRLFHSAEIDCICFSGGNKDNAIPREATAFIVIDEEKEKMLEEDVKKYRDEIKNEYISSDADIEISVIRHEKGVYDVIDKADLMNILFYVNNIPNGVINMSSEIKGLVETSLNLGILSVRDGHMNATSSVRSSVASRKKYLIEKLCGMAEKTGGDVEIKGDYPEWTYKKESEIRSLITEKYNKLYNKNAITDVIHAGLECGYISEKIPDMDIIAFGPDIFDIHTTEERMSISSVERVYKLIIEVLKDIR